MTSSLPRVVGALLLALSLSAPAQTPPAQIPPVVADTLAGEHVRLPADLQGKSGILVLGFGKDARAEVRDWGKRLAADYFASPTVLYYEIAVVAGVPRFMRGLVLSGIASEVSDRGKHHFLPVTDNEARWRALAHVTGTNHAYILVVDSTGSVLWTATGPLTEAAYAALRAHLPATPK